MSARRQADQALVPTASNPQAVSTEGFDPSRFPAERTHTELCIGIVNPYGQLWTDETFPDCDSAEKDLRGFWGKDADKMTKGFKLCMVRVSIIPESEPFDLPSAIAIEARSDATGTGAAEGESAAIAQGNPA